MLLTCYTYYTGTSTSGALSCGISGRPVRVFVLDLLYHTQTTLSGGRKGASEMCFDMALLARYLLQHIEANLPRTLFEEGWEAERAAWRQRVEEAGTASEHGFGLLWTRQEHLGPLGLTRTTPA